MGCPETTEQELVRRANLGEVAAFESLYRRHRDWVVALAMRFVVNEQDALDILQDTFDYFFAKFPGFVLSATIRGFLFPVVRHKSFSVLRRRRPVVPIDTTREALAGTLDWQLTPFAGDLERMVRSLPEAHRQVVLLRFGMRMSLEEIAEAVAAPLGTVKSRLHHALRALRTEQEQAAAKESTP